MALQLPYGLIPTVKLANIDERYGPYASLSDAKIATGSDINPKTRELGLTLGVIESGNLVEYWFKSGILDVDLVSKAGISMNYPSNGIAIANNGAWGTSLTDNSINWNNAYSWGNHANAGYVTGTPWTSMNYVTGTPWTSMGYITGTPWTTEGYVTGTPWTSMGYVTGTPWKNEGYLTSQISHDDVLVDGDFTSQGFMRRGASAGSYSILALGSGTTNFLREDGTWAAPPSGGTSKWSDVASSIYYNGGNVGIGNTNPTSKLHVTGDVYITGTLTNIVDIKLQRGLSDQYGYPKDLAANSKKKNGTVLRNSNDTEVGKQTGNNNYILAKKIIFQQGFLGKLRVTFSIRFASGTGGSGTTAYARVFSNGSAIGVEKSTTNTTIQTFDDIITHDFKAGESIDLYAKTDDTWFRDYSYVSNFRLYYDNDSDTVTVSTSNS